VSDGSLLADTFWITCYRRWTLRDFLIPAPLWIIHTKVEVSALCVFITILKLMIVEETSQSPNRALRTVSHVIHKITQRVRFTEKQKKKTDASRGLCSAILEFEHGIRISK
jgi:hypothetical protein